MRSEHFSCNEENTGVSRVDDASQDDEDKLGDESPPESKWINNAGDLTATRMEESCEENWRIEHKINEDDSQVHELEQSNNFNEPEETGKFVAAWIQMNFPAVVSEAELKAQAEAAKLADRNSCLNPSSLSDKETDVQLCEECNAFAAAFVCEECALAFCFRCTDAIHIVRSMSSFGRFKDSP
ncbi:unnamed protein product [Phytophthora lilii]|uniref:Unnamed protein product n=1 Tax=Phytophthora lilii TaxID=2077276 RepID=A0A9W6U1R9_9STRA|nr:unnamed protein product [Phytophthora lilii]